MECVQCNETLSVMHDGAAKLGGVQGVPSAQTSEPTPSLDPRPPPSPTPATPLEHQINVDMI